MQALGLSRPEQNIIYRGTVLPPRGMRFNQADYQDDAFYLTSADSEADRVVSTLGYTPDQYLVDLGCGQGRLAIGLARRFAVARYLGLDVSLRSIEWCRGAISARHPAYQFRHLDVVNARYNPTGRPLTPAFRLPVPDLAADIVYMWGLVTNLEPEHMPIYAGETSRILRRGGQVFVTANVEDDVPAVSVNPEDYLSYPCSGPLHVVRYQRQYFLDVFESVGLELTEYVHHGAGNAQSELSFVKTGKTPYWVGARLG